MARPRKFGGRLSDSEWECLQSLIKKPSEQARRIQRARIMLMADEGKSNGQIAEQLHVSIPTIVKTLKKWSSFGIEGALDDLQRSGRRSAIGADIRIAQYESGVRTPKHALLCTLAEALGVSPSALDIPRIKSHEVLKQLLLALEDESIIRWSIPSYLPQTRTISSFWLNWTAFC